MLCCITCARYEKYKVNIGVLESTVPNRQAVTIRCVVSEVHEQGSVVDSCLFFILNTGLNNLAINNMNIFSAT